MNKEDIKQTWKRHSIFLKVEGRLQRVMDFNNFKNAIDCLEAEPSIKKAEALVSEVNKSKVIPDEVMKGKYGTDLAELKKERILCAAIHYNEGEKLIHQPVNIENGFVVTGLRHGNCFSILNKLRPDVDLRKTVQGFLTSKNRFVEREEALQIAVSGNQLIRKTAPEDILFSEDLY